MKKTLISIAILGMLLGVATVTMAVQPDVSFYTKIRGSGKINLNQVSRGNMPTMFENDYKGKGYSTFNFNQVVRLNNGLKLENKGRLNGQNPSYQAMTMKGHGMIQFDQDIKVKEGCHNWDEIYFKNKFSKNGKYMMQDVKVNPTENPGHEAEPDRGRISQMGMATLHNGVMAMLGQKIKAKGDYIRGLQQTNIGGFSQSKIESFNQHDWVNLEQHLMFGTGLA